MAPAAVQHRPRPRRHRQRGQLVNKQQETVLAIAFGVAWLLVLALAWILFGDSGLVEWVTGAAADALQIQG